MIQFEHGFALLIGVDENNVPAWSLPDVAKDISAVESVLIHPERCAYPPGHVKTITGKNATRQGILDGLEWLQDRVQEYKESSTTAVIYYTGHGWRDEGLQPPNYYLIPYDVRQENVRSRAIRAEDFADAVRAIQPHRLLVVLDCCHSGGMEIKDLQPAAGFLDAAFPPALLVEPAEKAVTPLDGAKGLEALGLGVGRAVLSSSQGQQLSYIRKDRAMSIFTYHLIEALTGHAQPQEGAGEVLVSDMMSHVWRRVPKSAHADWGMDQQPDYQVSGNFPVALLLGGKGLGIGQAPPDPLEAASGMETGKSYAVNTGGGDYIGRDKVVHGDEVRGDKVGGDKITVGNVSGSGIAIGRGAQASVTTGISGADLDGLFEPIFRALRDAPPEKREEAVQRAEELQAEVAKGEKADDSRMAKLLDGLIELVPGAVTAVVSTFATPVLAGIAGPITRFILDKLRLER